MAAARPQSGGATAAGSPPVSGGADHSRKKSVFEAISDGISSVFEDKEAYDPDNEFAEHVVNARKLNAFIKALHDQASAYLAHIYQFYGTSYRLSQSMRAFYAENGDSDETDSLQPTVTKWETIYRGVHNEQLAIWRTRLQNVVLPALTQHMTYFAGLEKRIKERAVRLKKKNHYQLKIAALRGADKPDIHKINRNVLKHAQFVREFDAAHLEISSVLASVWMSRFYFVDPLLIEVVKLQALFNNNLSQNLNSVFSDLRAALGKRESAKAVDPKKAGDQDAKIQQLWKHEQAVMEQNRKQKAAQAAAAAQQRAPAAGAGPGGNNAAAPAVVRTWGCPTCTYANDFKVDKCGMCQAARPAHMKRPSLDGLPIPPRRPSLDGLPVKAIAAGGANAMPSASPPNNGGMMNFQNIHAASKPVSAPVAAPASGAGRKPSLTPASEESDDEEAELDKQLKQADNGGDDLATEIQRTPSSAGAAAAAPGWDAKFAEPDLDLSVDINRSSVPALYKIVKKLGEGSYAPTFLATNVKDNRSYVIKKIPCASLQEANNALHEAINLCLLRFCPNICSFQDVYLEGTDVPVLGVGLLSGGGVGAAGAVAGAGGAPAVANAAIAAAAAQAAKAKKDDDANGIMFRVCIVMEYCAGGDMRQQLEVAKAHYPEEHILNWILQICTGLNVIHNANLIHRDIKPANIFLDSAGGVRIGDFGVATILHKTQDLAMTHIGTPAYMAPEVLSRKPYDKKSDVWSLGCLTYEMVTLKTPNFQFRTLEQVLATVPAGYSHGLKQIIARMLQVDPTKRPESARLLSDVRQLMLSAGIPVTGGNQKVVNPFGGAVPTSGVTPSMGLATLLNQHSDHKHTPAPSSQPKPGASSGAPPPNALGRSTSAGPGVGVGVTPIQTRGLPVSSNYGAYTPGGSARMGGSQHPIGQSSLAPPTSPPASASASPPVSGGSGSGGGGIGLAAWNPLRTLPVQELHGNIDRNLITNAAPPQPLTAQSMDAYAAASFDPLSPNSAGSNGPAYQTLAHSTLSAAAVAPISYDFAPRASKSAAASDRGLQTIKSPAPTPAAGAASMAPPAASAKRTKSPAPKSPEPANPFDASNPFG